jgi:AcrR family transcriptional regulator
MARAPAEPQQDRSRATRSRVLEAAVECLAEQGWAGSTVGVVAARAGVSRGAVQHHFPTREELFGAAFGRMAETRLGQVRAEAARLGESGRTEAVLAMLAGLYTGVLFRAALHLHTAAVADESLRAVVVASEARVNAEVHRTAVALLGADEAVPGTRELVQGTLDLLRGLALADVLTDDGRRRRRVLARWAAVLDAELGRVELTAP